MINSMQLFFIVLAITIGMASGFPITPAEESTIGSPLETNTPANSYDVPMWLLCLIAVAASGIFVMLLVGCAFCILTCLKRRSKYSGIDPMLEAVIIDNKQLQDQRTHFYFPSREELKQLVREEFEEE